jgi:glycosyltransferase involved in cell wall biosynthesis
VFTGTLAPKKGILSLFKAWPTVRKACNGAVLHVFGKDSHGEQHLSMMEYLRSLLESGDLETVKFHGHVSRDYLFTALRDSAAAVFPSYAEAFALGPMEAMANGCPTVYSRRTSGPELINDGQDGLLVDPDHVEEIAAALLRLLNNHQFANKLGCAGRRKIEEKFSTSVVLPKNEAFFGDCIKRHRHSGNSRYPGR